MSMITPRRQAGEPAGNPNSDKPLPPQEPVLVPFVLGVTGHRDLRPEDEQRLRERVREIFQQMRHAYSHTPNDRNAAQLFDRMPHYSPQTSASETFA